MSLSPSSPKLWVAVDEETHERMKALAKEGDRSIAAEVRRALREYLERQKWPGEDKIK